MVAGGSREQEVRRYRKMIGRVQVAGFLGYLMSLEAVFKCVGKPV